MKFLTTCLALLVFSMPVKAAEPIRIGDLSSYAAGAAWAKTIKDGLSLALEEINADGGINGRPIELISRDDGGGPAEALRAADEMFLRDDIQFLVGTNFANIELALSDYAKRNKQLFVSLVPNSDEFLWEKGHDYAFRASGPSVYALNAMFAERAAKKGKLRWAGISHNYAWGQSNHEAFKENLIKRQPNAEFISEHWPAIGKINAGAVVQAMLKDKPDAIYTALFGSDLIEFIREGKKRGLFDDGRLLVGDFFGRPEFLAELKGEMPEGVITLAIPTSESSFATEKVRNFAKTYEERFEMRPRYISMISYHSMHLIADALRQSKSLNIDDIRQTLETLKVESIFGETSMRSVDNVANNGMWIGTTAVKDGEAFVSNVEYMEADRLMPSNDEIQQKRK